jgi:hypothetical protein
MSTAVILADRHPYLRGALAAILGLFALITLYLLIAWRFPALLSDPDGFLNSYSRHVPVEIESSIKKTVPVAKAWGASIREQRTDTEWREAEFNWHGFALPLPDPTYPIYYSKTDGGLLYVHRAGDTLQVMTVTRDGRLARGPTFARIPFFGTTEGGTRPLHPEAKERRIIEGAGTPLYVGENPREAYVIEGDRKHGPYDSIDSAPSSGVSKAASPLFLARRGGQCLVVIGDQAYTF